MSNPPDQIKDGDRAGRNRNPRWFALGSASLLLVGLLGLVGGDRTLAVASDVVAPGQVRRAVTKRGTGPTDPGAMIRLVNAIEAKDLPSALLGPPPDTLDRTQIAPVDFADPEAATLDAMASSARPLSLPEAIDLAFRVQPRLHAQLETIEQARGAKGIAFSAFLPMAFGGYKAGGLSLHTGGSNPTSSLQNLTHNVSALPGLGVLPANLVVNSAFELAELRLQYLVLDFGRRLGVYEQAKIAGDVATLQTQRAFQTVGNDVASAYYGVLRAQAFRRTSTDAARRALADLADARKQEREGVITREVVLRGEVQRAETRQTLRSAAEEEFIALAALNLAIGLKGNQCVRVVEPPSIPEFPCSLAECLETAIRQRFEFQVARRSVDIASAGTKIARAEFAPKVLMEGTFFNLQQASPTIFADQAAGSIGLEWRLFEGGRKLAQQRVASSELRAAMAQVESIADNIAYQVNESYRRMITARSGIDDARPAVDQSRENYRLVRARTLEGNATPAEITDAQAALTRSEQNYLSAVYGYLTMLSKLEYAMGTGRTPSNPVESGAPASPRSNPGAGGGATR